MKNETKSWNLWVYKTVDGLIAARLRWCNETQTWEEWNDEGGGEYGRLLHDIRLSGPKDLVCFLDSFFQMEASRGGSSTEELFSLLENWFATVFRAGQQLVAEGVPSLRERVRALCQVMWSDLEIDAALTEAFRGVGITYHEDLSMDVELDVRTMKREVMENVEEITISVIINGRSRLIRSNIFHREE